MIVRKWEHAGTICAIRHGVFGVPCGYVRVPEGHPFHGRGYDECDVDAWGGLTYSGALDGEDGWWIGFDMAHPGDIAPTMGTRRVARVHHREPRGGARARAQVRA